MTETAEIPLTVLTEMKRSLYQLKESKRLLVSAPLDRWLRDRFSNQYGHIHEWDGQWVPPTGDIFFKGVPVVVCELLQGHEYAFVK